MSDIVSHHEDSAKVLPLSLDIHQDNLCQPCERKGKRHEPAGYCRDCMKYLCDACHSSHLNTKLTKHHVLFDWKSPTKSFKMPKIKMSKSVEDACTTKCDEHTDKVVEYFCSMHDSLGCSLCMAKSHMGCENVKFIPEISAAVEDNEHYRNYLKDLISMTQNSHAVIRTLKETRTKAELHGATIIHKIREHRKHLDNILDEVENELLLQVDTAKNKDVDRIENSLSKYEGVCREVERLMSSLQGLHHSKQKCQLFVTMKVAKASLQPLHNILNDREEIPCMFYKFHPNFEVHEILKNVEVLGSIREIVKEEFGHSTNIVRDKVLEFENRSKAVDQMPTEPASSEGHDKHVRTTSLDEPDYVDNHFAADSRTTDLDEATTNTEDSIQPIEIQDMSSPTLKNMSPALKDISVNLIKNIYVRSNTDFYPVSVTSSALLHDNNLVIVDTANWNVKLVDTQKNEFIQEIKDIGCPWDITNVYENEVAVTYPILKKIVLLKYGPIFPSGGLEVVHLGLIKERDMNVRGHCYGIAHAKDKFVVTFAEDWLLKQGTIKLEILNMYGHVLQRIMGVENGERLLMDPKYVAVGDDTKTIFVSDWGDHSVTSITTDGDVLGIYEDGSLQRPGKLVMDSNSTIFVCGQKSFIHRLTTDCYEMQVAQLPGNGQSVPRTISVSEDLSTLYTGMMGSDFIRVYQIV